MSTESITETEKLDLDIPKFSKDSFGLGKKIYIETYGCQMNFSDSEIISSILKDAGMATTSQIETADVILFNTCSIRENAEQKIRNRLDQIKPQKKRNPGLLVGVLGCMAERLKSKLLEEEKIVDLVAGPDSYRTLPQMFAEAEDGNKSVNVFLSREETYSDINPVRLSSNGVTAYVSIMRGCDNMCSFCVVPYTRGRERSRDLLTILKEIKDLHVDGFKEVTLLGQNVDSYKWENKESGSIVNFPQLLDACAQIHPEMRIRFSTSHPKDITDEVLHIIKKHENICNHIHLPAQSGSTKILEKMTRTYTREWYLERIKSIKNILGDTCGISTDIISGFCSETQEDHEETLSLMREVQFNAAYMFSYSERPGTPAAKKYIDDVSELTKKQRLAEIMALQNEISLARNKKEIGRECLMLVEGTSKKSELHLSGKISENKVVIIPAFQFKKGDYVKVRITDCTAGTLFGEVI